VYLTGETSLTVRRSGRSNRIYAIPSGCRPQGLSGGVVALLCPGPVVGVVGPVAGVLIEATGMVMPVRASSDATLDGIRAVGSQWLLADRQLTSRHGSPPGNERSDQLAHRRDP
jgi:hypothetical protein